jgi:acetyl-CoA C-acetyltransferase
MSTPNDDVLIVAAKRTPIGAFQGQFSALSAPQLGAAAVRATVEQAGLPGDAVDEVLMGCVLPAGVGQAPARQAALGAGLPKSVTCTTVSKVCGSGMRAVMIGHDAIRAGTSEVVVAGGMESMTNAPHFLPKSRQGYRLGHTQLLDHMFFDGLQDAYEGHLMGHYAEESASSYRFSREDQDAFARESVERAQRAVDKGTFRQEIVPVAVKGRGGEQIVADDETPGKCDPARISTLKPAFRKDGTVTAANASSISDGAAALMIMGAAAAAERGIRPLARIVGHAGWAQEPDLFTSAPVGAIGKLLDRLRWSSGDVDLFEINEAFACVTMIAMRDLKLPHQKVNVAGGACALGHPIGASGARLIVTLLYALQRAGKKRGIASLCIGGGEATAIAIELL